jgi:hypothetical protein
MATPTTPPPISSRRAKLDPTADAAGLLRRIGFGTLTLALPAAALVSRRAGVVLAPIGVALIVAAMVIDNPAAFIRNLRDAVLSRAGLLLVGLTGWVVLAATWSPWREPAVEKAMNIGFAVALGIAGAAALPARMRATNLNLIALGVGAACLLAVLLGLSEFLGHAPADSDGGAIGRGLALVSVMAWPALAWLLSRGRSHAALALALLVALVALMRFGQGGAATIIVGLAAFGLVTWDAPRGARWLGAIAAGLMLLAPLLPFVLMPLWGLMGPGWARGLEVAADVVRYEPVKLITGHGLDSVLRGKLWGVLPADAPATILFETWYELGLVGAVAAALCLWFAMRAASRMKRPLAAGGVAAYATAFTLAALGQATLQFWWLVMLSAVAIMFTAIARGQVRTERPIAPAWFGKGRVEGKIEA